MVNEAELIALARNDPERAIETLGSIADAATTVSDRCLANKALGLAHRISGANATAIEILERALAEALEAGADYAVSSVGLTLSGTYLATGRIDDAMALLDPEAAHPQLLASTLFQRGTTFARMGRLAEARRDLDAAEQTARATGDSFVRSHALTNRGHLNREAGQLEDARKDYRTALEVYTQRSDALGMGVSHHNLAMVEAEDGDLAGSLRHFNDATRILEPLSGPNREPARAHALLAAGLFEEAHAEAMLLIERLAEAGVDSEIPEMLLVASTASSGVNLPTRSHAEAQRARQMFGSQGRELWADRAALVAIAADESAHTVEDVLWLIDRFEAGEAPMSASRASAIAARLADPPAAERILRRATRLMTDPPLPIALDLMAAAAELAHRCGDETEALAIATEGCELVAMHQESIAATDVRAGVASHARRLVETGLAVAVGSGDPHVALSWMERSRATALRFRPVTPPTDPHLRELSARLRRLTALAWSEGATGDTPAELRELERAVVDRWRSAPGTVTSKAADAEELVSAVAKDALVELAVVAGSLWAATVHDDVVTLTDLGPADPHVVDARRIDSDMRRVLTEGYDADRHESLLRLIERVGQPFRRILPEVDRVTVVPTPTLAILPFRDLFRRPLVNVAPSGSAWLAARLRTRDGSRTAALSGPDLINADLEAEAVATATGGSAHVQARIDEALAVFADSDIVHLACHGHVRVDQPLMSSVSLADGPLYLHEIEALPRLPGVLVLSSCETGVTSRTSREMLGMTSVLLSAGMRTIIASPWPIPDIPETAEVMCGIHERLQSGDHPVVTTSRGQHRLLASAFSVFGA